MAINLSVRQIMQSDLILRFEEIIKKTSCPPQQLQFEVTEGIDNIEEWDEKLHYCVTPEKVYEFW